jgi:hypothetical protein
MESQIFSRQLYKLFFNTSVNLVTEYIYIHIYKFILLLNKVWNTLGFKLAVKLDNNLPKEREIDKWFK